MARGTTMQVTFYPKRLLPAAAVGALFWLIMSAVLTRDAATALTIVVCTIACVAVDAALFDNPGIWKTDR